MADVAIKLPDGMSQVEFEKLFATFQKQRVNTAAKDKAVRQATREVLQAHKDEYDALLAKYIPKA